MLLIVGVLTLFYALPVFPNHRNARYWKGCKVVIVALSWVGMCVVLPFTACERTVDLLFVTHCIQCFLLVFSLVLIFEIVDLTYDDPQLKTIPQLVGVGITKCIGVVMLLLYLVLELFYVYDNAAVSLVVGKIVMVVLSLSFLLLAHPERSRNYAALWVEAIPVAGYLFVIFC